MSGQGKKYWFSVTNKRLTHQPITRKIIVCKTLNVIFFFFFFILKKKKKLPTTAHPDTAAATAPRRKLPHSHPRGLG
jgi:hypothetical protein